jgi:acetyl/propionyl-CoA carboxylase alpha subunit
VTWGVSRDEAIARMRRALREYRVLGIRTTIPFFVWLLDQPEYRAGRYDTTYLDRLLEDRRGEGFTSLSEDEEELVAMAAGVDAFLRAGSAIEGGAAPQSRWTALARREALRG